MTKRVVLAYSGGLDTSVAVRWMIEEWGVEVVCVLVDVGQDAEKSESFADIMARARAAGAVDARRRGRSARDGPGVLCEGHRREREVRR